MVLPPQASKLGGCCASEIVEPGCIKCGLWTSGISITWEGAGKAEPWVPSGPAESESAFQQNPCVIHVRFV